MALPSAQLGSLPGMSMPGYQPVVQIQKEPKAWEKILMGVLANAAQAVATQGIDNAMTEDHAPEFGEEANTGMSKFWHGPKVSDKEGMQRREISSREGIAKAEMSSADARERHRMLAEQTRDRYNAKEGVDRQTADLEKEIIRQQGENTRTDQEIGARSSDTQRRIDAEEKLLKMRELLDAEKQGRGFAADAESKAAGARYHNAQAESLEGTNRIVADRFKKDGTGQPGPANQPPVNPNIARMAKGNAAQVAAQQQPDPVFDHLVSLLETKSNSGPAPTGSALSPTMNEDQLLFALQKLFQGQP